MIMEKNFTSPKQSEKLIEFGIIKNTADSSIIISSELPCDWREHRGMFEEGTNRPWFVFRNLLENRTYNEEEKIWNQHEDRDMMLPSWSFGRLVEMYEYCTGLTYRHDNKKQLMDDIVEKIEHSINCSWFHRFSFTKLREFEQQKPMDHSPYPIA